MSTLPPRRTMPDDVRERLRTQILGDQRPSRSRVRVPLAAAAVIVVVAGALALTTPFGDEQQVDPATSRFDSELDRCWTALVDAGKTAGYPDRSEWRGVVDHRAIDGAHVTAAWAGDQPLFCQTTQSQVTVSDPNAEPVYLDGTRTSVQLTTEDGAIGGVLDPTWAGAEFSLGFEDGDVSSIGPADDADGLFVTVFPANLHDPRTELRVSRRASDVPGPPIERGDLPVGGVPTPVVVYDRPGYADPDPFTGVGLMGCPRIDIADWDMGAGWPNKVGGRRVGGKAILIRQGDLIGLCDVVQRVPDRTFTELGTFPVPAADDAPVRLPAPQVTTPAVMGLVSPSAAYVDVYFGDFSLRAAVANSTFGVEDAGPVTRVEVFDRNHALLYSGPFSEGG